MPNPDPAVWQTRIDLNLTLFQALPLHGHLLLALRHPGAQEPGLTRETVEDTVAVLTRMLLHCEGLTADEARDAAEEEVRRAALALPPVARLAAEDRVAKVVHVPGRIVNVVTRP